jgi:hypothetical protein|tara:strand:- start:450 stop:698 length:249 start_codon:yes stop_codon:yes gene_type:complete
MSADFIDLVQWVLVPLVVIFSLWVIKDCLQERSQSIGIRVVFVLLIALFPVLGGVLWFRFKEKQAVSESRLMARVKRRRGGF